MPIYEYQCQECDHKFEKLQKFDDPAPAECPSCGKNSLQRVLSTGTGFVLMGYGWTKNGMN
jgi:putative FmdB family regulatory protein